LTFTAAFVPEPFIFYIVGIVTAVTISLDTFIFPVILSWKSEPPRNIFKGIIFVLILIFGFLNTYYAIKEIYPLLQNYNHWPNTFANVFNFFCKIN